MNKKKLKRKYFDFFAPPPPLKKGAYCFATVGQSVGMLVCILSLVRSISFDPFTWSIPNLVQGLPSMSRWSLFIFRSHVQRSRSNYSFEPSVLSTLYILIPWLLASYRFCFYREDKPEICTMGGIDVSETFLVKAYYSIIKMLCVCGYIPYQKCLQGNYLSILISRISFLYEKNYIGQESHMAP